MSLLKTNKAALTEAARELFEQDYPTMRVAVFVENGQTFENRGAVPSLSPGSLPLRHVGSTGIPTSRHRGRGPGQSTPLRNDAIVFRSFVLSGTRTV